eukprot:s1201_g20.t1
MGLGPICTLFSKMGLQTGVSDPKFVTHKRFYENFKRMSDVMLIENVPEYRKSIAQEHLGEGWDLEMSAVIDPRLFGVPAARARLYMLAFNKAREKKRYVASKELLSSQLLPVTGEHGKLCRAPPLCLDGDDLSQVVDVPLLAMSFEKPVDGLPLYHSWLGSAKDIFFQGFENWREILEVRARSSADVASHGEVPQVQVHNRKQVGVSENVFDVLQQHLHCVKFEDMLTVTDSKQFLFVQRVMQLHTVAARRAGKAASVRLTVQEWDAECDKMCLLGHILETMKKMTDGMGERVFSDEMMLKLAERCIEGCPADKLALVRDVAQVANMHRDVVKSEKAIRTERIAHMRGQNCIGASIVAEHMSHSMAVHSGPGKDQLSLAERAWSLSDVQEAAQLLAGEDMPLCLIKALINKPPPPSEGTQVDPANFPLRLVKLEVTNPTLKGWDKYRVSIPPAIRARYMEDQVFGEEWKQLLKDFDSRYCLQSGDDARTALALAAKQEEEDAAKTLEPWTGEPETLQDLLDKYIEKGPMPKDSTQRESLESTKAQLDFDGSADGRAASDNPPKGENQKVLPMTVSACGPKTDPPMSAEKIKELQESLKNAVKGDKSERKEDAKSKKTSEPPKAPKPKMTAKAKSKAATKKKKDDDEDSCTLDSEEPPSSDQDSGSDCEDDEKTEPSKASFLVLSGFKGSEALPEKSGKASKKKETPETKAAGKKKQGGMPPKEEEPLDPETKRKLAIRMALGHGTDAPTESKKRGRPAKTKDEKDAKKDQTDQTEKQVEKPKKPEKTTGKKEKGAKKEKNEKTDKSAKTDKKDTEGKTDTKNPSQRKRSKESTQDEGDHEKKAVKKSSQKVAKTEEKIQERGSTSGSEQEETEPDMKVEKVETSATAEKNTKDEKEDAEEDQTETEVEKPKKSEKTTGKKEKGAKKEKNEIHPADEKTDRSAKTDKKDTEGKTDTKNLSQRKRSKEGTEDESDHEEKDVKKSSQKVAKTKEKIQEPGSTSGSEQEETEPEADMKVEKGETSATKKKKTKDQKEDAEEDQTETKVEKPKKSEKTTGKKEKGAKKEKNEKTDRSAKTDKKDTEGKTDTKNLSRRKRSKEGTEDESDHEEKAVKKPSQKVAKTEKIQEPGSTSGSEQEETEPEADMKVEQAAPSGSSQPEKPKRSAGKEDKPKRKAKTEDKPKKKATHENKDTPGHDDGDGDGDGDDDDDDDGDDDDDDDNDDDDG